MLFNIFILILYVKCAKYLHELSHEFTTTIGESQWIIANDPDKCLGKADYLKHYN